MYFNAGRKEEAVMTFCSSVIKMPLVQIFFKSNWTLKLKLCSDQGGHINCNCTLECSQNQKTLLRMPLPRVSDGLSRDRVDDYHICRCLLVVHNAQCNCTYHKK